MEKEFTPRRKRMAREAKPKKSRWQYTELDQKVLFYLARYRYLRGTFMQQLCTPYSVNGVNKALAKLRRHGYVDKPGKQEEGDENYRRYRTINDSDIYEITHNGFLLLGEKVDEALNLIRYRSDMPHPHFKHGMMIADAVASLEIGVQQSGYRFIPFDEIIRRVGNASALRLPCTIRHNGVTVKTTIIPDAVFAVEYPDGRTRLYLVEAEHQSPLRRTQIVDSSTMRKMLAYKDVQDTKAIRQLGKSNFTVLFVFPTKGRTEGAPGLAVEMFGQSALFLFNHQPVQERSYRSPKPNPDLFIGEWLRGGLPSISIKELPTS
jgi:hypothetical protein